MASYTAVVGDVASVGTLLFNQPLSPDNTNNASFRRNPQLASARIRSVVAPHIVYDAVGGFISADFSIPADEAQRWRPQLRFGAVVWLFDGLTPICQGWAEQPVWTATGDCQMTLTGVWGMLGKSRMREAWEIWDMTLLSKGVGANENKAGSVNINTDGTLTLSIPAGTIAASDRCSVDYLLFGEVTGGGDDKMITAFEFDISDSQNFAATRRVRVIGKATPGGATGDQLYDTISGGSSGVQGACNLAGTNQGGIAWPSNLGYRCLRFEIIATAGATIAADWYATFDRIRMSTRERMFPAAGSSMDTAAVARDLFTVKQDSAFQSEETDLVQELWSSVHPFAGSPDANTNPYPWGLDPRTGTGTAPNSGVGITGFTALEWQSPADILAALAAIDGYHVGFYLPYNGRGGYDCPPVQFSGGVPNPSASAVGSFWLSAPPQLYYQPFPDPILAPDYTIHTREGAQVSADVAAQPLEDMLYVNYQTLRGRQLSVVTTDTSTKNYAYAQGYRRAEDYTIQPAVGNSTLAASLGQQQMNVRRQPFASATITISADGTSRYPILKSGAAVPKLALIHPGSIRIVDVASSSGLRAGYATHVEWWGATLDSNEHVEISLAQPPGQVSNQRAHGILAERLHRSRITKFGGGIH